MPIRETQIKPAIHTTVGGVNQRVQSTELPAHEYENQDSVFPEFAGLQSKLWGKRTLAKYADSIYGIYQFWTPQGYGVGLYQFNDKLDAGQWQTPTGHFPGISDLPPSVTFDPDMFTYDELGNHPGGYSIGGSDSLVVDPANGGPAGQGLRGPDTTYVQKADYLLNYTTQGMDFSCQGQGVAEARFRDLIQFHNGVGGPVVDQKYATELPVGVVTEWHGVTLLRADVYRGIFSTGSCPNTFPPPTAPYIPADVVFNLDKVYHIYAITCAGRYPTAFTLHGALIANGVARFKLKINGNTVFQTDILGGPPGFPTPVNIGTTVPVPSVFGYTWWIGETQLDGRFFDCNVGILVGQTDTDIHTYVFTGPFV